jgi:fucose 4-O-acetylase-like acetyltransferase
LEYSLIGGGYARLLTHNYSDRPLWFLLVLFALNLWTYGLEFLRQRSPRWACLLAVWLTVAGYVLGCRGVSLPCYLVRTLLCFPFFYLGYIGRKGWLQLPVARPRALGFIACVILAVGMACRMQLDVMMVRVDARPWLYTVVPLAGVVATLIVSGYVEQSPRLCAMLSYFGRNSLYIFACHWPWLGLLEHELPTWIPDPKAMCLVTTVTVLAISLLMGAALRRWLPFVFR